MQEKLKLVSFDQANNFGATDLKMDGSVSEEKSLFKKLRPPFSFKVDWEFYTVSIVGITLAEVFLNWLNWFKFLHSSSRSTCYSNRLHDFSVTIPRC